MQTETRDERQASRAGVSPTSTGTFGRRIAGIRRQIAIHLSPGSTLTAKRKLLLAGSIFLLAFAIRSLHATDLSLLMHTAEQPALGMTEEYNQRAHSILDGHGILIPDNITAAQTGMLARPPGYPIYLSAIYKLFGENYFIVQVTQNLLTSLSVVLIFLIAGELLGWNVGVISGALAAVSHHFAYYSNFILPDALSALPLLAGFYLLLPALGNKQLPYWRYGLAGVCLGIASWLRPNLMLVGIFSVIILGLISARPRRQLLRRAALVMIFSIATISPITIRNYLIYGEFIPIQLGSGFSLWAGIAEAGGERFGAVASDRELIEQEAALYNDPRYGTFWAEPDGIKRDRDRVKRSMDVIKEHPVWYAESVLWRIKEMVKYSAHAPLVHKNNSPGIAVANHQIPADKNPLAPAGDGHSGEYAERPSDTALVVGNSIAFLRPPARALQRIAKETALPFILIGTMMTFVAGWRRAAFLMIVPLYFFVVQATMATEFRYTLPMHYFLFTFAAVAWVLLFAVARQAATYTWRLIYGKRSDSSAVSTAG